MQCRNNKAVKGHGPRLEVAPTPPGGSPASSVDDSIMAGTFANHFALHAHIQTSCAAAADNPIAQVSAVDEAYEYYGFDHDMRFEGAKEDAYAHLLFRCLSLARDHKMTLKDIYTWMEANCPRVQAANTTGWQNSIRHNLSMNKGFERVADSNATYKTKNKSTTWQVTAEALLRGYVFPTTQFRNRQKRSARRVSVLREKKIKQKRVSISTANVNKQSPTSIPAQAITPAIQTSEHQRHDSPNVSIYQPPMRYFSPVDPNSNECFAVPDYVSQVTMTPQYIGPIQYASAPLLLPGEYYSPSTISTVTGGGKTPVPTSHLMTSYQDTLKSMSVPLQQLQQYQQYHINQSYDFQSPLSRSCTPVSLALTATNINANDSDNTSKHMLAERYLATSQSRSPLLVEPGVYQLHSDHDHGSNVVLDHGHGGGHGGADAGVYSHKTMGDAPDSALDATWNHWVSDGHARGYRHGQVVDFGVYAASDRDGIVYH